MARMSEIVVSITADLTKLNRAMDEARVQVVILGDRFHDLWLYSQPWYRQWWHFLWCHR